jgi:uncharacterized protein YdaU (DUF1376 family)
MGWTAEERGHYIVLLITQWEQGGIPANADRVELISAGVSSCWATLEPKFPLCDDGLRRNARLEEHRRKATELQQKRHEKAALAARARWGASSNAQASTAPPPSKAKTKQAAGRSRATRGKKEPVDAPSMRQALPQRCPPSPSPSPTVKEELRSSSVGVGMPVDGGGEWSPTAEMMREWSNTYPSLDVAQQIRIARQWLIDNPKRRKSAKGMRRFVGSWLSNASKSVRKPSSKTLASL